MTVKERLLYVCEGAKETAQNAGDTWGAGRWDSRHRQALIGIVHEKAFAEWLKNMADFWHQKDREYGEYLEKLAGSFK